VIHTGSQCYQGEATSAQGCMCSRRASEFRSARERHLFNELKQGLHRCSVGRPGIFLGLSQGEWGAVP